MEKTRESPRIVASINYMCTCFCGSWYIIGKLAVDSIGFDEYLTIIGNSGIWVATFDEDIYLTIIRNFENRVSTFEMK